MWKNLTEEQKTPYIRFLDGYKNLKDGYTENPFGHYKNVTATHIESEYFMQWVFPQKLHRICLLYTSPSPRDRTRSRMPSSA